MFQRMALSCILLLSLWTGGTVTATSTTLSPETLLRKSGSSTKQQQQLVSELLLKIQRMEERVEELQLQVELQHQELSNQLVDELDAATQDLLDDYSHHRHLADDNNNKCLPKWNSTHCVLDYPIIFQETAFFQGPAAFNNSVRLLGGPGDRKFQVDQVTHFDENVYMEDRVLFDDDVKFKADVYMEGPEKQEYANTATYRNAPKPNEFVISGRVGVLFKQDKTFVVDAETKFLEDVYIGDGDKDSSDSGSKKRYKRNNADLKVDGDLKVGDRAEFCGGLTVSGDELVVYEDVIFGDGMYVKGKSAFYKDVIVKGDIEIDGYLEVKKDVKFKDDVHVDGDLKVGGDARVSGDLAASSI